MFERFVYIKLNAQWTHDKGRNAVIAEAARVLPVIPGVLSCRSGRPAGPEGAKGWDMCLILQFNSEEDIETYRVHPAHQRFLTDFLEPKVEAKRVWNFAMTPLASSTP